MCCASSSPSTDEPLYLSSTPQTEELSDGPPLLTRISPITDVRSLYSDKDDEEYDSSPPPLPLPVLILSPTSAESQDQYGSAPILRREITSTPTGDVYNFFYFKDLSFHDLNMYTQKQFKMCGDCFALFNSVCGHILSQLLLL